MVATVFANREMYLVLANYQERTARAQMTDNYVSLENQDSAAKKTWDLPGRSLRRSPA